ncbi:MAG: NCS2 family permease [Planctomycetaceae bacterium]
MDTHRYPLFVKRDLDGFFGLFIDNMVQLLAIAGFCGAMCGMSGDDSRFVYAHILPGAAVSILFGNIFYAWQAHRLARREGRSDVTALPYGINTPSMIVYVMFVMKPVYDRTQDASLAWQMGLIACLGSGIIEFCGAFVANTIRKHTPRAALLSTLAGIAIGFISMSFALQIFQRPLIAMLPLALILITLFARVPFPLGLPGGLIAVVAGTTIAWFLTALNIMVPGLPDWVTASAMQPDAIRKAVDTSSVFVPQLAINDIRQLLTQQRETVWGFLTIIIPMGLFNLIGSLQNIESAEAGGDSYDTRSSLAVNGLGTMVAACFGSCFPTTIYIGHPGWKALGARAGYSTLNGLVITLLCLLGVVGIINSIVPIESGIAIVLWIGIVITAQAFQATPNRHAPAVAMGLFPAIAAWGTTVMMGAFIASGGKTIQQLLTTDLSAQVGGFLIHGMVVMERGYIFTCMILAAVSAFLIDRRFFAASAWSLAGGLFSIMGLTHAYQVSGNDVDYLFRFALSATNTSLKLPANGIAIGYLLFSVVFLLFGVYSKPSDGASDLPTDD